MPNKTVLFVEDDAVVVEFLTRLLEERGFKVLHSDRMDSALAIFHGNAISAVITDFHIQQGSGRRLLYEIRKGNGQVPVFLITGTPFVKESDFANLGFTKVFLKPFPPDDLVDELKRACGG
jgi:DNA-binding NtrC family response regulator